MTNEREISIIQYLRPKGRRMQITSSVPTHIADKVEALQEAGYEISMEKLTTGQVAMYVTGDEDTGDIACEICQNGPEVPTHFNKMIEKVSP